MSEAEKTVATTSSEVKPKKRSWRWRFFRFVVLSFAALVTLFILFHAVENWRGKRAWDQYRKEQEAKGVSFDFNSIVPPPVPEEKNFAMTPLLKPLYEFNPPDIQPRHRDTNAIERIPDFYPQPHEASLDLPSLSTWRYGVGSTLKLWQKAIFASTNLQHRAEMAEPADDVLYALKQFDAQLDELHQASQTRPLTRYQIEYAHEPKVEILLPHLTRVKNIEKVLAIRASAYLEKGEVEKAFDDVNLILFVAEPLKDEPIFISHLVRKVCFEYGIKVIWLGMVNHKWKPEHLTYWQSRMTEYDFVKDIHHGLQGERLMGDGTIEFLRRNPHRIDDFTEMFYQLSQGSGYWVDFEALSSKGWLCRLIPDGWFYMERVNYNQAFDRYLLTPAAKEKTTVDVKSVMDADGEFSRFLGGKNPIKHVTGHTVIVKNLMPALTMFFQKAVHAQSTFDLALVAMALEKYHLKHQDYPETLSVLVPDFAPSLPLDILSKAPFKYERQSKDAFRLWSLGWNLKDDGGVIVRNSKAPDATIKWEEGDWTWPQVEKALKTKEGGFE